MTIKNYKGIKATMKVAPITEEQIMDELVALQQANAQLEEVNRPAEMGDTVNFDFEGWCEGVQFPGGTAEEYDLELGSHKFIPGFEEGLVGVVAGDAKDIDVTFPEQYEPSLAGKPAVFKCKIRKVCVSKTPEINDEFAKAQGDFESLDQLKAQIAEELKAQAEGHARGEVLDSVLDVILEENPIELDADTIEKETKELLAQMIMQMSGQQMDVDTFCGMAQMKREDLYDMIRPSAQRNASVRVLINAIAEQEGIDSTDEEINAQIKATADIYGMDFEQFKSYVNFDTLKADWKVQKTMDFLYDNSVITKE